MSISTLVVEVFLKLLRGIFLALQTLVFNKKQRMIPPSKSSILMESATTIAQRIRNKKVSSAEVVKTFIDRIEEINGVLNCVVDARFEEAMEEAKKVDELIASGTKTVQQIEAETPFLGVPFTTKDCIAVKGLMHTSGVYARKDIQADKDAEVVALLRKAGAIPLALTNVTELCLWYETNNPVHGRTDNPYDTNRTVGGSSGGEGCLVSASGTPLGIGTDLGGSVRLPAAFNGVFGHKSSAGVTPIAGIFPVSQPSQRILETTGPLSRYSADLLPVLKVMTKSNPKLKLDEPVDVSKLKVYYMEDDGGSHFSSPVSPEIKKAIKKVAEHFQKTHKVVPQKVNIGKLKKSINYWCASMRTENGDNVASLLTNNKGKVNVYLEIVKSLFGLSRHTSTILMSALMERFWPRYGSKEHKTLLEECEQLKKEFQDMLGSDGIFIYPTHPKQAFYHSESLVRCFDFGYTAVFNAIGLPATSCPTGCSADGLPVAVQVVAGLYQDRLTIAVARDIEKAFGGWTPPPTHGTMILNNIKLTKIGGNTKR